MPRLRLFHSSSSNSNHEWLSPLLVVSKGLVSLGSCVPFPYVNSALSAGQALLELIQIVHNSNNDLKYIAESVVTIMKLLREEMDSHPTAENTKFRQLCLEFDRRLNQLSRDIEALSENRSTSKLKKYFNSHKIRDEINDFIRRANDLRSNATLSAVTGSRMELVAIQRGISDLQREMNFLRVAAETPQIHSLPATASETWNPPSASAPHARGGSLLHASPAMLQAPEIRHPLLVQAESRFNITPPIASFSRLFWGVITPCTPGIYPHTFIYLTGAGSSSNNDRALTTLNRFREVFRHCDPVSGLVYGLKCREALTQISAELGVADHPKFKTALAEDRAALAENMLDVLYSPAAQRTVFTLKGDNAQSFLDIAQDTLDNSLLHTQEATSKAHMLVRELASACGKLPSPLIIVGVMQRVEHPAFYGSYGDVFLAEYQGKRVALKRIREFNSHARPVFDHEVLIWQRLRHPRIMPFIGIDATSFSDSLCMVSPLMANGTVLEYLKAFGRDRKTVDRLIREIAEGLDFLHGEHVVHGDLCGENILVDDNGHACLTDFGRSVLFNALFDEQSEYFRMRWLAPELIASTIFRPILTPASDIYAFGCVCLELYTGYPPFEGVNEWACAFGVVVGGVRPSRPAGDAICDGIWDIMQRCWSHNLADRPSIRGILAELDLPARMNDANIDDSWSISSRPHDKHEGWFASVLSPFNEFIDRQVVPRNHYLDLQRIACGACGTTLYVARLADAQRDQLMLPSHVKEKDRHELLAGRPTCVAIKMVPLVPGGSSKLDEVLRELRVLRLLRCDHILGMDALYVDVDQEMLWIRMELMTRTLSSIIELNGAGLVLSDRIIAGCMKDILEALKYLALNDITPRNVQANSVSMNSQGFLKLTNVSNAVRSSTISPDKRADMTSDCCRDLGALVWEMATGSRPPVENCLEDWPPLSISRILRTLDLEEFTRMCLEPGVGKFGYLPLLQTTFIRNACERPTLAQLLIQCTAFEGTGHVNFKGRF
ncbi:kinase-like domain-containing protein [Mycena latifolia]|nr:kinase-like domain-containing protein [Mycena latifolia]